MRLIWLQLWMKVMAGAAVDVFTREPLPADHPYLTMKKRDKLLLPHIGWASKRPEKYLWPKLPTTSSLFKKYFTSFPQGLKGYCLPFGLLQSEKFGVSRAAKCIMHDIVIYECLFG